MTSSAAVMDFLGGAVMAVAYAVVMGVAVRCSGSGYFRGVIEVSHLSAGVGLGAMSSQGAKSMCVFSGVELVSSALRPMLYRSCAVGGCLG